LPHTLEEALAALERGREWVEGALGKDYVAWFLSLKGEEMKMWKDMVPNERKLKLIKYY
jgi:glutamine synthetase